LASTGRGNRRWDGSKLAMTQEARDNRLLGHEGLAGTSIVCPPVDRQVFEGYFSYFIR